MQSVIAPHLLDLICLGMSGKSFLVAAGQTTTLYASALHTHNLTWDGSAALGGFSIIAGDGDDVLTGGQGRN